MWQWSADASRGVATSGDRMGLAACSGAFKMENKSCVSFYNSILLPAFVMLISREIARQRRLRRLATEYTWVGKLPDYLRTDTRDVNQPLSLTAVILCLATVNYQKIIIIIYNNNKPHVSEQRIPQH